MGGSFVRQVLNDVCGLQDVEIILPHPFLPPRFKKLCRDRNMILYLDLYLTIRCRWEGARINEHISLTPGQAKRLFGEVLKNTRKFSSDSRVFCRFLEEYAEPPYEHPRFEDSCPIKGPILTKIKEEKEEESNVRRKIISASTQDIGGESPMGELDSDY